MEGASSGRIAARVPPERARRAESAHASRPGTRSGAVRASAGHDPRAGQRLAARFLRNRLERLGWQPGARDGWFHSFPLVEQRVDPSGCAALLALAEALAAHGPLERPVLMIWFAGEEPGMWGSQAFVQDGWYPDGARPAAVINLDMVGRNAAEQLLLAPSAAHASRTPLSALAESLAPREGFSDVRSGDDYFHRSDQASFSELRIPLLFVTGEPHDDYHAPTDDAERVDADKVRRTARLVFRILDQAQTAEWARPK